MRGSLTHNWIMNEEWPATASGDDDHENVLMHFLLGPVVFNVKLKS